MNGFRQALAVIVTGMLVLLAAGCGKADHHRQVVKVGILHSQSGPMAASEKPVIDATVLALEQVNQQRLIPGVRVEWVIADGRSDPATFAREAERLITEEDVVAIFGCWTSASRKAVKTVVEQYDSLLFYPVQYEGIESSPNVVYLGAAPNQQIIPAVHWAMETLGSKFFLVGSDTLFPHAANTIIKDQLKAFGAEVAGEVYLPMSTQALREGELDAIVEQIKDTRPSVILNTLNGSLNTLLFRKLREAGITSKDIPSLSFSIGENELREAGVRDMVGDYAAWNYFQSIESPTNRAFIEALRAQYGETASASDPMEAAYDGVMLWAKSLADARQAEIKTYSNFYDTDAVLQFLGSQSLQAPEGMVFVDAQNQHLYKTVRIGRIQADGNFEIVWQSDVPIRPEPYPVFRSKEEWEAVITNLNRQWGGAWDAPR
ncbi:urea ABC transporter substrate-binding protein [Ruficoccus amylovorans]|uniref:Urea ABC transporter substrate-binding protein n=1 Tax=Ruficoccus amylovorans TaxID=1804625 RepID=A0A842HDM5_9BACT|nr:urea ABC transporter substrate-binding protein [Ruficoccus amylovorans]MBC2593644.1 urea ABC transporter substrate-binding protein [Ruficoccus amylovorans]